MKISGFIFYLYLAGSCILLSVMHCLLKSYIWIPVIFVTAFLWRFAVWRKLYGITNICFLFFIFLSAKYTFAADSIILPAISILITITCWDAEYFTRRLNQAPQIINRRKIEKAYMIRLAVTSSLSLIPVIIATKLTFRFGFIWILMLSLIAMLVLGRIGRLSIGKDI